MAEEGAAKQHFSVWLLVPEPQRSTIAAAMKAAADAHGLPTSEPHITLLGDAGAGTEAEMTTKLAALAGIGAVPINFAKSGAVTAGIGTDGTAPWNQSAVAVPALTPELSRAHRAARQAFRGESAEAVASDAWAPPLRQPHISLAYGNPPEMVATLNTPPDYVAGTVALVSCTPPTLAGVPNWRKVALVPLVLDHYVVDGFVDDGRPAHRAKQ